MLKSLRKSWSLIHRKEMMKRKKYRNKGPKKLKKSKRKKMKYFSIFNIHKFLLMGNVK
jgi:hypothetical protein